MLRRCSRNNQTVWWANYVSDTAITDIYGNDTGQRLISYTAPTKAAWSVSYVDSDAETEMFGTKAVDTIRIVADKAGNTLTETSILWYGITPNTLSYSPTAPGNNFAVIGIRPSLNELVIYARKV